MIDIAKAKEIVKSVEPNYLIRSIVKVSGGWLFSFMDEKGEEMYIAPLFISEEDGSVAIHSPREIMAELKECLIVENNGEK